MYQLTLTQSVVGYRTLHSILAVNELTSSILIMGKSIMTLVLLQSIAALLQPITVLLQLITVLLSRN